MRWTASASSGASSVSSATGSRTVSLVSSTGSSCTVTLAGRDAEVQVFGTRISLGGVREGRASLRIGNRPVSCTQGGTVSAGQLTLRCTGITQDSVTFTGSLG